MKASARIAELERQFDAEMLLCSHTGPSQALRTAAVEWSRAVWLAARTAGATALMPGAIERGFQIAQHPICIAGVHRSGTTLVRDLLDGHPAIAVLPSEGTFMTSLAPRLQRLPPLQHLPCIAQEWLRRLANPINRPPYWTLGRSSVVCSPYVGFARALMGWWDVIQQHLGPAVTSWPLMAVALAYAQSRGGLSRNAPVRAWAEKTPTNERYFPQLAAQLPHARFIHVVRHPFAVYASRKALEQRAGRRMPSARRVMHELALSYRIAAERSRRSGHDRHLVIRYEDLIANTERTMDEIADFLEIDRSPTLLRPTVAGVAATNNSSYPVESPAGQVIARDVTAAGAGLTSFERDCLVALVADHATRLGYTLEAPRPWRARFLRFTRRLAVN
jgi:hypothetical protein